MYVCVSMCVCLCLMHRQSVIVNGLGKTVPLF